MDVETRMTGKPAPNLGRLVCAVIVHHQMDVEIGRDVGPDGAKKGQKLAAAVASVQLPDDLRNKSR